MKKRVLTILLSVGLVLLLIFAAVSLFRYLNRPGRLKDREFQAGSKIRLTSVTERKTESLCRLAKVWGFVKYRHPSVVGGQINWDAELFRVMPKVLEARTPEETDAALFLWLEGFPYGDGPATSLSDYLTGLSKVPVPDTALGYAAFLKGDPRMNPDAEEPYPDMKYDDTGMRLLGLFRYWNVIEYFFPYKDIMGEDWDGVLRDMLPEFVHGQDALSYVLSLSRMSTYLHDTHALVDDPQTMLHGFLGRKAPPVEFLQVDGNIVVSAVDPARSQGTDGLLPGDIVLTVNDTPMEARIDLCRKYLSLSDKDRFVLKLQPYLLGTNQGSLTVKVLRGGKPLTLTVECFPSRKPLSGLGPSRLMVEENIGYLNPGTFEKNTVDTMMKAFQNTKGLIVDLRNYPKADATYSIADFINPKSTQFSQLDGSNPLSPGSFIPIFSGYSGQGSPASSGERPLYAGKVVVLMDERSMSQSEFAIMSLRAAPSTMVMGSTSVGADGNVVLLKLPGGVVTTFTGLSVFYPDGSPTQRVGLKPDIFVTPTVEGLRDGRDELVERAVAWINR